MVKFPKIEIDIEKFYTIGMFCFGIMALANTVGFITNLTNGNYILITDAIYSGFSMIFTYALFGFFAYLRSQQPPKNLEKGTLADMEKLINQKEA